MLLIPGAPTQAGWDLQITNVRSYRHTSVDGKGMRIPSNVVYEGDQVELECEYRYVATPAASGWEEWKAFIKLHNMSWIKAGGDPPKVNGELRTVNVYVQAFTLQKLPYGALTLSCELNTPVTLKGDPVANNAMSVEITHKPNPAGLTTESPAAATARQIPAGQVTRMPTGPKQPPASMPATSTRIVTAEIVFIGSGEAGTVPPASDTRYAPDTPPARRQ